MERLLLFLSKTDKSVYDACPQSAKNTQLAFGLFVLLTGLLAFCSGTFACSNLFTIYDVENNKVLLEPNAWWYAAGLGLFYACMIMAIDREVVAAKNKLAVIPRLILAIVIGVIVAVPLELELLEGRIEKELKTENSLEIKPLEENMKIEIEVIRKEKNSVGSKLQEEVKKYKDSVAKWQRQMEIEASGKKGGTRKKGYGPAYYEAEKNKILYDGFLTDAKNDLNNFKNDSSFQKRIDKTEADYKRKLEKMKPEFDLLSKFQTLNTIVTNDTSDSTFYLSWGIRLLFILFEIIPSFIKLITPATEYDKLMEARRRLNTQLINTRSNDALTEMESEIDRLVQDKNKTPLPYMKQIRDNLMS